MTKQVGTKPYQTPRNADLGTLAYQDHNDVAIDRLTINDFDKTSVFTDLKIGNNSDFSKSIDYGINITRHGNGNSGEQGAWSNNPPAINILDTSGQGPSSVETTTGILNIGMGRMNASDTDAEKGSIINVTYDGIIGPLRLDGKGNLWTGWDRSAADLNTSSWQMLARGGIATGEYTTNSANGGALIEGAVGVRNNTPLYDMHVGDDSNFTYVTIEGINANVAANLKFIHNGGGGRDGVGPEWNISRGANQTNFGSGVTANDNVGGLAFWNVEPGQASIDSMRLKDDGNAVFGFNVGIQKTNPLFDLHIGNTDNQDMKIGWREQRNFVVGIHTSELRYFKMASYTTSGYYFVGKLEVYTNRGGGFNQVAGYNEWRASIGGYSDGTVRGSFNVTGPTNGFATNVEPVYDSSNNIWLKVPASVYGGSVLVTFEGICANWTQDGTYVTTLP